MGRAALLMFYPGVEGEKGQGLEKNNRDCSEARGVGGGNPNLRAHMRK